MFVGNRLKKFIQREGVMISADDISNHISESPDPVFNPAAGLNLSDFDSDSDGLPEPAWIPEPVIGPEVSRHSDRGG